MGIAQRLQYPLIGPLIKEKIPYIVIGTLIRFKVLFLITKGYWSLWEASFKGILRGAVSKHDRCIFRVWWGGQPFGGSWPCHSPAVLPHPACAIRSPHGSVKL